jgi:hypothetical protein
VTIGALVKHFSYDGLGRLIRTLSPYPEPGTTTLTRSERFYYDGIRRIQEVVVDPVFSVDGAEESGDPGLIALAEATTEPGQDESTASLEFEEGQINGAAPAPAQPASRLDREYVWGPGDAPGGIDELLAQYVFTTTTPIKRNPWWVIQDAGGDCVALCDTGAANADGRVVAQYTYDAYGQPLVANHLYPHPYLHAGHKGLFLERLDTGVVNTGGTDNPRLVQFARLLCHNRNRSYQPYFGRFNQEDPNATAMVLLGGGHSGNSHLSGVDAFAPEILFQDGSNLYSYLGACPWMRSDPMGLSWVEDYEHVILPIISMAEALMPVSGIDPLTTLLEGYTLMGRVHSFVQNAAYTADEDLDWAMDWSLSDDANPRGFAPGSNTEAAGDPGEISGLVMAGASSWGPRVNSGRRGMRSAIHDFGGTVPTKRQVLRRGGGGGRPPSRLYDLEHGSGRFMEVKSVRTQQTRASHRVIKQIQLDRMLVRQGRDVKEVRWIFYTPDGSTKFIHPDIIAELNNSGIPWAVTKYSTR